MKNIFSFLVTVSLATFLFSCQKSTDGTITPLFVKGKNRFTITVDGIEREYYVHVPNGYNGTSVTPLVIMFHGTNQSGEQFYNISGWKEVGDSANILTVFPSALRYCISEDGVTDNLTKWTIFPGGYTYCPGNIPADDIKFMRQMLAALKTTFNVDAKKVYCAGFSNGGGFSGRCAVEMSDVFAAAVSSGAGGALPVDTTCNPVRLLPTMLMFGNKEASMLKRVGLPPNGAVPMGFIQLYATYPILYYMQPKPYINSFRLNPVPVISGDTNSIAIADYSGISGNPNNVFKMLEIKNMEHEYANGINHPFKAAVHNWAWFKQFSTP